MRKDKLAMMLALCETENDEMSHNGMRPVHPGEILLEEYLKPLEMSSSALAKAIGVPANRISTIVKEQRGITGDTAIRLAEYFDTTPGLWMNLQATYDLKMAEKTLPKGTRKAIKSKRREDFASV